MGQQGGEETGPRSSAQSSKVSGAAKTSGTPKTSEGHSISEDSTPEPSRVSADAPSERFSDSLGGLPEVEEGEEPIYTSVGHAR